MKPRNVIRSIIVVIAIAFVLAGCPKGTMTHKVTVAQHNFKSTVQAFQDAEIAEYNKGFVDNALHIQIQSGIQKVALGGVDLDNALAAGANATTLKAKLDNIYTLLDAINQQGVLPIGNATTKATLEIALDAVKAIIDTALVQVQ